MHQGIGASRIALLSRERNGRKYPQQIDRYNMSLIQSWGCSIVRISRQYGKSDVVFLSEREYSPSRPHSLRVHQSFWADSFTILWIWLEYELAERSKFCWLSMSIWAWSNWLYQSLSVRVLRLADLACFLSVRSQLLQYTPSFKCSPVKNPKAY